MTVNHSHADTAKMKPGGRLPLAEERLDEEARREHAADFDDEHDRVTHLVPRVELAERVDEGAAHDGPVEERTVPPARADPSSTARSVETAVGFSATGGGASGRSEGDD